MIKREPLADRLKSVYDRLYVDNLEITLTDAQTILEAVSYIRISVCFDRSLSEAFNSGDGAYRS